ncbi:hypothetical protein Moror_16589 [Moniliophthora roreri MCA 2997]|uniref:Uncharacterized protein n=1 Tax=Moniliophthora roreri (strain MCA 2997) TaxID=1381753 RepID=V2WHG4_MONRO|nr:hypothetical protein Moror_16589 [Moniliophthora roreri MCA 2997]
MSSEESLGEHLAPYVSIENVIVQPVSTVSTMLFVHGIYIMIFGACLHILLQRRGQPNQKLHLGWTISLFVLSTMLVVLQAYILIRQSILQFTWAKNRDWESLLEYVQTDRAVTISLSYARQFDTSPREVSPTPYIVSHMSYSKHQRNCRHNADTPMLCHMGLTNVDGRSNVFCLVSNEYMSVAGLVAVILGSIAYEQSNLDLLIKSGNLNTGYFITNVIVNGIITLSTAGRIWQINRQARKIAGYTANPHLQRIIAIILESGALYPAFLIAYGIMQNTVATETGIQPINLAPIVTQVAGIAPTLIIVRASLGKTTENVDQVLSTLHFAERDRGAAEADSQIRSIDLERTNFNSSGSNNTTREVGKYEI